ncbi:hypothetical protein J4E83_009422 [Alternaria metachromatica]|uniref:uncharacterized protein n=1 Tax=Alternaria metachromatica TaxID=283354 RepID=UPI0020C3DE98|nr:uncharacterized protein J4E83_009422 [Alternaria metachromatica]KAI4607878.1 hypothetical protein J4E83_009422 [Alternaria metachromatica]
MSTLRLATASNVRAFQILTEALDASNGKWSQWIESETLDDEVGRFRVWAGNLGALQKGHSSLDYRLRGSPVLFSSALRLLNELEQNLNETYAIVSEARLPYEQQTPSEGSDDDSDRGSSSEEEEHDSDSDEPRSELRMRYEEIVDIIDNLYKLSVRIRTPTVRSRSLKASAYTPVDPETGVDILGVYAELDRKHVRELLSQLRKTHPAQNEEDQDFLTERLSSSITLRRRHFKYWKRHRDKLGASADSEEMANAGKPTANEALAPMRHDTLEAHPDLQPYICTHRDCESAELLFRSRREWAEHEATHRKLWRCPEHVNALYNTQAGLENHLRQEHIGSFPDDQIAIMAKIGETIAVDSRDKCPICFVPTVTEGLGDLQSHIANHLERLASFALPHGREDDEDGASSVASRGSSNSQSLPESIITGSSNEMVALSRDLETEQSVETELNEEDHLLMQFRDENLLWKEIVARFQETFSRQYDIPTMQRRRKQLVDLANKQSLEFEFSEKDRLLLQLKEKEHMPWKDIAVRFSEVFGTDYRNRIPALQMRMKRVRERILEQYLASGLSGEDRLLLQLSAKDRMPWEEIQALFRKAFGKEYEITALESRVQQLYEGMNKQSLLPTETSRGLLSAEILQQLPDESQNRMAVFSNQVDNLDDLDDSEDEQLENEQPDENILPEHQKHLEEREAFRQHVSSLPGVLSVRFYRGYGSWTGLITFADDLVGEQATALFDAQQFPNVVFKSKRNKSKWTFTRITGTSKKDGSFVRQSTVDTQTTEEAEILPPGSETYDEEHEDSSKQPIITTAEIPTLRSLYQSRRLLQRDQSFAPNDAYNQLISFCHYDLTRLKVDAIVSNASANFQTDPDPDSLHHAIYKAGGPGLREEARSKAKVKVGQVELTHGHNLPSSWVIHAVAPGYTGRKGVGQFNVLSECYRSVMRMAANYEFKTIAFPCLGTGGCMFPARVAARIALQEIREYLDSHPTHRPERIIFCVRAAVDEKAYTDFLPVFFPPTHGDLDRARTSDWSANRAALATQVLEARTQLQNALTAITVTYDFGTQSTVCAHDMRRIDSTLSSIRKHLLGSKELKRSLGDLNLLCSVTFTACADIMDMAERARKQGRAGNTQSIWTEANSDIRVKHGFELTSVFDYSWIFANSLEEVLILGKAEPDAMGRARQILETYGVKQKGQDAEGIRDHLDEVLYVREAERPTPKLRGLIQVHQIPPVARLYILGQLEAKPTMAKPSTLFNHTVCLVREDITRLEVDIVVNSTDPSFSGMGTLDRSIFKKGGDELRSEVSTFGKCEEGDVKATAGYLLPAKHILHVVPPGVFRSDTKNILRNIYRAILHDAVLMRATSIAIPSIGTGMRNYPRRDCASLAMEEVKRFLESAEPGNGLDKIIFVVFSSNDEFVYKSLLPIYFPPTKGNTSPTILAEQPAQVEESSSSSFSVPTDQPSPSIPGEETTRSVRLGKQPVNSRRWHNDAELALATFDLHIDYCSVCKIGLDSKTHRLCEAGYRIAQEVSQQMEMAEDANVYSKADKHDQRERLKIPIEKLPYSMSLLSTIAKDGVGFSGFTFAEVEKTETTDFDTPVSKQHPIPNDPDNIAQATEQPAVVRVEILSPRTDTGDWFYSWVRVFRSKIEMYSGDYDPDPYGESTGHAPYAWIDFADTATNVDGGKGMIVSLWTVPQGPDQGETWHFRSSEVADSIALLELFKRAINRGRQERKKKITAEVEETTGPEATIIAEIGRDVLEDSSAGVKKPDTAKLDVQVQKDDKAAHFSEAEDANVVAPDAGPRAVIRVETITVRRASGWTNAILYVYEGKIVVELEENDGPDQPYVTIDLTSGIPHLGRRRGDPGSGHVDTACLRVTSRGDWEEGGWESTWYFRSHGESDTDAMFNVLQEAVDRNRKVEKKTVSTEVEETTSPGPTTAPIAQREETGESLDASSYPKWNQRLRDIKDQVEEKHHGGNETSLQHGAQADTASSSRDASANLWPGSRKPDLDARILTYLYNDFKTRPGSYIGQNLNEIALALKHEHHTFIAHALRRLAAEGKVHNTVDGETWVISQPNTKLRTSDQEDQPEEPSEADTDDLAYRILLHLQDSERSLGIHSIISDLQTCDSAIWPAIRQLVGMGLVGIGYDGQIWAVAEEGRKRARESRLQAAKSGKAIQQVTGSTPGARPSPSSYWSMSELQDFEINVARFGTDWTAMANHMGTKTPNMIRNQYLRLVEAGKLDLEHLANEADCRNAPASQQLATESLESMNQPTSEEGNATAEERGDSEAQLEKDSNQDEDTSNSLADRALSYLRSLSGVSENISDLATTFDTPVAELQPVLKQLRSDGLVHNTGDNSTWAAAISTRHFRPRSTRMDPPPHSPIAKSDVLPRSDGGGYNMYPCPNWQKQGHPSIYDFVDRKDELCAHCIQAPKREGAVMESATHDDDTSTTHIEPPGSGSAIMDAAINSGQIHISESSSYDNRPWNQTPLPRTQIPTSFIDERILIEQGFKPDKEAGVYYVERKVGPEETGEWLRRTKELQVKDSQIPQEPPEETQSVFAERGSDSGEDLQMGRSDRDEFVESVESIAKAERRAGMRDSEIEEDTDTDDAMVMNFAQTNRMKPPSWIHVRRSKSQSQSQGSGALHSGKKKLGHATEGDDGNSGRDILDPIVAIPEKEGYDRLTSKPAEATPKAPATDQASSWRDGRGTKERRQTRFSRAMTGDIEEDVESGTASSLRKARVVRERKHNESSKAKKEDIDDELEDYDGQEEDFV